MTREQRTVFGEVAEQYDAIRPTYPDELFDAVLAYSGAQTGDRALEIGAGTGKATRGFLARGLDVHAIEPSVEMAAVLRANGVVAEPTTFEAWPLAAGAFRIVYAAQAWHWVAAEDRYEKAAAALAPDGGTLALFWNHAREWDGELGAANEAVYAQHAPALLQASQQWDIERTIEEMRACAALRDSEVRVITWEQSHSRDEHIALLQTASNHRLLPDAQRERLHAGVAEVIDAFGGRVPFVYDTELYLSRRS